MHVYMYMNTLAYVVRCVYAHVWMGIQRLGTVIHKCTWLGTKVHRHTMACVNVCVVYVYGRQRCA